MKTSRSRCGLDIQKPLMRPLLLAATLFVTAFPSLGRGQTALSSPNEHGFNGDFTRGADLSMLSFIEDHGVSYKEAGRAQDALVIFKNHGCNYVRLRLFVRPDGTQGQVNTLPYTLSLAKRVKQAGLRWLLDLHYSDDWADPAHQVLPAHWKGLTHKQLIERVYTYTKETLSAFEQEGCLPDMVQVGNEITNGMMWPDGGPLKSAANFDALADLVQAGIRAVRECGPASKVKVMIHVSQGGDQGVCKWFYDNCRTRHVNFDVIGLSYYPFWHGSLEDLAKNLAFLANTYQKDIVVAETGFNWRGTTKQTTPFPFTPEGQRGYLEALEQVIASAPGGHGKGFFYWAPEWIEGERWDGAKWSGEWEDRALFDREGNMLPALDAYKAHPPP